MAPRPPSLVVDLVEEFLLRFPPDEPASLVRAALVCKEWRRIVASPDFRRRFREHHRTPPMLGVLCDLFGAGNNRGVSRFIPTSPCPPLAPYYNWCTLDARHGRVLRSCYPLLNNLDVWEPATGEHWELPEGPFRYTVCFHAAVLCAAHGTCNHIDCHHGFLVVLVDQDDESGKIRVHVYSSESGIWNEPIYDVYSPAYNLDSEPLPPALVGNAIYFVLLDDKRILKYDLPTQSTSVIQLPPHCDFNCPVLMTLENGGLGLAALENSRLYLWSIETSPTGRVRWTRIQVIELQMLLPANVKISYDFLGFAHGVGVFFLETKEALFSIHLKSRRVKKVCDLPYGGERIYNIIPYMSFYTPALGMASTGDAPNASTSST